MYSANNIWYFILLLIYCSRAFHTFYLFFPFVFISTNYIKCAFCSRIVGNILYGMLSFSEKNLF